MNAFSSDTGKDSWCLACALAFKVGVACLDYNYGQCILLCCVTRQQRMAEILALQQKAKFGSVKEITAVDYVDEVNKAGEDVWVVLHLYRSG